MNYNRFGFLIKDKPHPPRANTQAPFSLSTVQSLHIALTGLSETDESGMYPLRG